MNTSETTRKIPVQRRAQATVDVILEAAIQLLETDGEAGFNTNALAERAGVSVGTLYRYFPDKRAILLALARREMQTTNAAFRTMLTGDTGDLAPDRAVIRTFLHAFGGRNRARRAIIGALIADTDPADRAAEFVHVLDSFIGSDGQPLSPIAGFVLSRAVHGAMRAAVMEGVDFLLSQEFEDELVRLGRAYLALPRSVPPNAGGTTETERSATQT